MTDGEWLRPESLLPDRTPRRGGRWIDHRLMIGTVLWRTRTGSPWRDLPECYGNWKTAYYRDRRWAIDGAWVSILDELRQGLTLTHSCHIFLDRQITAFRLGLDH
ncbi:transposase [Amycolatopsis speibonae]|uniref:Transposase n=1 Tax=Amycolatopsis speibonae TaxID=1450224 RepID=A0ABV7PAV8_9PSEU